MKHYGPISGVAAHDCGLVATAGYDNQVLLWKAGSRTAIQRVFHDHLANQCSFSPDGLSLVTSSSDYTARVWSVPQLALTAVLTGHSDDVEMAVFDGSGARVATCSRDHTARIYGRDGVLLAVCRGHTEDVASVTWDHGNDAIVTSSDDGTVRRWDASSGTCLETVDLGGIQTDTLVVLRDGSLIAGNDEGELICIRGKQKRVWKAHRAGIKRLVHDPVRRLVVSLSYDRYLSVWRIDEQGSLVRLQSLAYPAIVWPRSCAFIDDSRLAVGTFGSTYAVLDYVTGTWEVEGIQADGCINALAVRGDTTFTIGDAGLLAENGRPRTNLGSLCNFLTACEAGLLTGGQLGEVYEALSGRVLYRHHSPLNCAVGYELDGEQWAIIGTYTGQGLVFRMSKTDAELTYVKSVQLHPNAVKGIAASGGELFSVCATGAAAFHSLRTFECISREDKAHDRVANGCTSLSDGAFASVGRDRTLRIWVHRRATVIPSPHRNSIKCICVSADGRYVATGGYAGQIAVYDLVNGRWSHSSRPTAAGISSIAFDAKRRRFCASSYDALEHFIDIYTEGCMAGSGRQ